MGGKKIHSIYGDSFNGSITFNYECLHNNTYFMPDFGTGKI